MIMMTTHLVGSIIWLQKASEKENANMSKASISNANPQPIVAVSPQIVQEHTVKQLRENDMTDLNAFIEQNLHLVESRIKYVHGVNANNFDDVIQAGRLGLCNAARSFNVSLGVQFSTYAVTAIDNEMHHAVRACFDKCNPISLDNVLELEYELTGAGLIAADPKSSSPEFIYEQKMAEDALTNLIPLYPPKHHPALLAMVMRTEGYSKKQIVDELGIDAVNYRSKIHSTVTKLKGDIVFMQYVEGIGYKRKSIA